MGAHAISQVIPFPPVKPSIAGLATNVLALAPSYDELEREARGRVTQRAIEDSGPSGARLRRRSDDIRDAFERRHPDSRRPANDSSEGSGRTTTGEFGLHIAANPYPERVQHSTPFVAQVIGQTVADAGSFTETNLHAGVTAYDGAAARTESYFGAHAPVEFNV